jgi:hypothetical protein
VSHQLIWSNVEPTPATLGPIVTAMAAAAAAAAARAWLRVEDDYTKRPAVSIVMQSGMRRAQPSTTLLVSFTDLPKSCAGAKCGASPYKPDAMPDDAENVMVTLQQLFFVNPPALRSVATVHHAHVFTRQILIGYGYD